MTDALYLASAGAGPRQASFLPEISLEPFLNAQGEVRLESVRSVGLDVGRDRETLEALYQRWVVDDDYIVVASFVENAGAVVRVVHAFKARKRGNDVDVAQSTRQLGPVADVLQEYAGMADVSQLAFVTLTWDTKACTAVEAWERFPREWNRYTSRVRRRFGNVLILRSFEVTKSGYPHAHALLAFQEYALSDIFVHVGADDVARWRCNDDDRAVLSDWSYNVDVQAVVGEATAKARVGDVLWYVVKGKTGGKDVWNRAALWYLGKRSWSVSRTLRDDARQLAPRPDDSTGGLSVIQTSLPVRWVFLGMVKRSNTEMASGEWAKVYPEPPPWIDYLWTPKKMARRSSVSSFGLAGAFK
jgi:hypothetical protein